MTRIDPHLIIDDPDRVPRPSPPNQQPFVMISGDTSALPAHDPVSIQVIHDQGVRWVWMPHDGYYEEFPIVDYTGPTRIEFTDGTIFSTSTLSPVVVTLPPGRHVGRPAADARFTMRPNAATVIYGPEVEFLVGSPTASVSLLGLEADGTLPVTELGRHLTVRVHSPEGPRFPGLVAVATPDDRLGGWATLERHTDGSTWTGSVPISPQIGPRRVDIELRRADRPHDAPVTASAHFTALDGSAPALYVDFPTAGADVAVGDDLIVPVRGRTGDGQSGMTGGNAGVAVSLSEHGPWTPAQPRPDGSWTDWQATVTPTALGPFTLHVRASDAAGHVTATSLAATAVRQHVPGTLDVRLGDSQYLAALMRFAADHVRTPNGPVTGADLRDALAQPVDALTNPDEAALRGAFTAENELRLPIGLLHRMLEPLDIDHAPADAAAGRARFLAHHSFLRSLGTTRTEVRRARGADPATRTALADRLGIALSPTRPDELDELLLDSTTVTDADLARLFGLTPPTAAEPAPPGLVLAWQRRALAARWLTEETSAPLTQAIIDPDVIGAADIRDGSPRTVELRGLLYERLGVLNAEVTRLTDILNGPGTPTERLAAAVAASLPDTTLADLRDLLAADERGDDIAPDLTRTGLSRPGWRWLLTVDTLAGDGLPDHAEDRILVIWVLVAALRTRLTPQWRAAEAGVVLSPDLFTDADDGPEYHPLRIDPTARAAWRDRLRTRGDAVTALVVAAEAAVTAAEQEILPVVRDGLIAALAPVAGDIAPIDLLAARHHVDAGVSGQLTATPIGHAITSLQLLLTAVRTRDHQPVNPASGWTITNEDAFDTGWFWLAEKAQWECAVIGWLFPEEYLDPAGTPQPTAHFSTLVQALTDAGVRLTPEEADAAADAYGAATHELLAHQGYSDLHLLRRMRSRSSEDQAALAEFSLRLWAGDRNLDREIFWAVPMLLATRLAAAGHHQAALDWLWVVFPWTHPGTPSSSHPVNTEIASLDAPTPPDLTFPPGWTADLNPYRQLARRSFPYLRSALLTVARVVTEQADSMFATGSDAAVGQARSRYVSARKVLAHRAFVPVPPSSPVEGALPLPSLAPMREHVAAQLVKIRLGRDIAGTPRRRGSGTLVAKFQPTPYRFATLLARAHEMARNAANVEALYLSMLERYDAGVLRVHEASGALDLIRAQTRVQEQRLESAEQGVRAASEQYDAVARVLSATRREAAAPANRYEEELFRQFKDLRNHQNAVAIAQATATSARALQEAASNWLTSIFVSLPSAALTVAAAFANAAAQSRLNLVVEQISANQLRAGIEERRRSLVLQSAGLEGDLVAAGNARIAAADNVAITSAELTVARLQATQADRTLALLQTQFTNPDLYLWLSQCLGGLYRYHLQQATATARLAEAQLAFERVEAEPGIIAIDYWRPGAGRGAGPSTPSDTRGLTGAEYLQRDLTRLDEYAFSRNERRLNLSQTFSLAERSPAALLEFRRTGRLVLATPEEWFDADFPGHHHRLIKQVRVSLVALVPPVRGIRATLSNAGISRVVTPASLGRFTTVELVHPASAVALTSPSGASGVFTLDAQPELVAPFEGAGVDTIWALDLPRPANPIDYTSIADVQLSIDYTALADEALRTEVIRRHDADPVRSADRVLSLSQEAPDAWWALHQPDPARSDGSRLAVFTIGEHDLPSDLAEPRLTDLALGAMTEQGSGLDGLRLGLARGSGPGISVGEAVTDLRGIASTRRGAPAWVPLLGHDPRGEWTIVIDSATAAALDSQQLDDLVVMLTVRGEVARWDA